MAEKTELRNAPNSRAHSRIRRLVAWVVALIGFAAAVATLWIPIHRWLEPTEFRVHVLHPREASPGGVWADFDQGLDGFLAEWKGRLDGTPIEIRDKYKLSFQRETWAEGNEDEMLQAVDAALDDSRTLALVAATTTRESELILERLREEDEPPILLLALATKNDLLQEIDEEGKAIPLRGVFRMVPTNRKQAERLARTIVSANRPSCAPDNGSPISVAILREEGRNAGFSRDLAETLRRDLDGPQNVTLVVDSVVDSLVTAPRELVDLQVRCQGLGAAGAAEAAEQLAVVEEVHPQHLRDRERPQAVPDGLDHLLGQQGTEQRAPFGGAGGAEAPSLAREGHEILRPALGAAHSREAAVEDAAVEEGVDRVLGTAAPETVAALEVLLPAPLDLVVAGIDEPITGSGTRQSVETK